MPFTICAKEGLRVYSIENLTLRLSKNKLLRYLSLEALDQMTDCHTAGDGMRVDDHIWSDSFTGERHILIQIQTKMNTEN